MGPMEAMLREYCRRGDDRWHMPGHKGRGEDFPRAWDITEVEGSDNLHAPQGAIDQAQRLLARDTGAAHSHFLVGGSTAGLHAMLALLPPGEGLILSRWVHKAVVNAAMLYQINTHWVQPAWDEGLELPVDREEDLLKAMEAYPDAGAVLVTTPDYYGRCLPLEKISRAARKRGMLVLADSAHGAHLPFCSALPPSPAGWADLWVASAHKTLSALTQSAWLHASAKVEEGRLLRALSWVQSTSPSYELMVSLDQAREEAEKADWMGLIGRCDQFRQRINRAAGMKMMDNDDPTRLVVDVSGRGHSGLSAARWLKERGIELEMADSRRIVAIATPWDGAEKFDRLAWALERLPEGERGIFLPPMPVPGERVLDMACARRTRRGVPLTEAAGRVAADTAGAYPPGIALWHPGERITPAQVEYLLDARRMGCTLFGCAEDKIEVSDEI
jgi:arginine/lysine/ornithine decarboxylase